MNVGMKHSLFWLSAGLVFCGCETLPDDGSYRDSRRRSGVFQKAEKPVIPFRVEKETTPVVQEVEVVDGLSNFDLPDSSFVTSVTPAPTPPPAPEPSYPKVVRAQPMARVPAPRNATPPQAVQESQLPKYNAGKLSKKDLQYLLKELGFYKGRIDGIIGPQSKSAIVRFQKAHGLVADGIAGRKTKAELLRQIQLKYQRP